VPQLQDPGKKDGFTTEALGLAAEYEVSQITIGERWTGY
jgi:hypothetical protein